jgi:hypothetical protein
MKIYFFIARLIQKHRKSNAKDKNISGFGSRTSL